MPGLVSYTVPPLGPSLPRINATREVHRRATTHIADAPRPRNYVRNQRDLPSYLSGLERLVGAS